MSLIVTKNKRPSELLRRIYCAANQDSGQHAFSHSLLTAGTLKTQSSQQVAFYRQSKVHV